MASKDDVGQLARARLGTVLKGKWSLDSVLGIGGMACVYAATHRNQSRVAIKMLHPEIALHPEVTSRFLREGYVANAVDHPGTVKVLDDDVSDDGAPFLVMERLSGETLDARLERLGRLPLDEVMGVADQLLDVLAAAHSRDIVHRDLKPENLFLTDDGRIKVLDFGIARLRELSAQTSTATRMGSLLGTPTFMASEQALGRWAEVDGRTDLWAVGATLYTLLSGHFVHEGTTLQEQLVLAATRPAPPLRDVAPEVPAELAAVIDRALCFDQTARWPDARSMQQALRAAAPPGTVFPTLSGLRSPTPVGIRAAAPTEIAGAATGHSDTPAQALTRSAVPSFAPRGSFFYLVPATLLILVIGAFVVNRWTELGASPPAAAHVEPPASAAEPAPSVRPQPPPTVAVSPAPSASASTPQLKEPARTALSPRPSARLAPSPKPSAAVRPEPTTPRENPFDRRH